MTGTIEVDEKDVSEDGYIILEYPTGSKCSLGQPCIRVKTNIKLLTFTKERAKDE